MVLNTLIAKNPGQVTRDERTRNASSIEEKVSSQMNDKKAVSGDRADISLTAKMTSQLNGLHQALYNMNKANSLISVTDGHLRQMNDLLQKIRVLSVKSSNGVYTSTDRQHFQVQVSSLIDEVDRVASQGEYNRFRLLAGNFSKVNPRSSMWFQVGPHMDQRERMYISTFTARSLFLKDGMGRIVSISTPAGANRVIGITDMAIQKVAKQRADLAGFSDRLKISAKGAISTMEKIMQSENVYSDKEEIKEAIITIKKQMGIK